MPLTLADASRSAAADPGAQKEPRPMPRDKPKSIMVTYKGGDPLHHRGVVAKLDPAMYVFTSGTPVEVMPVPLDENGRVLPFDRASEAVAWDRGDIDFFLFHAGKNPGEWDVVDGKRSIPEKVVEKVAEAVKPRGRPPKGRGK